MRKYTPKELLELLHSITWINLSNDNDAEIEVKFDDSKEIFTAREFSHGTFTRELMLLLEEAMEGSKSDD